MAMAGDDFRRGEDEMDENCVTQLQALMRGYLTRTHLQLVREEYEQIFSEIEGSERIFVYWPLDSLCLPKTQKDRPTKKVWRGSVLSDNQTPVKKDKTYVQKKTVSPVRDDNMDLLRQNENISIQEQCTAETQTSFIEDLNLKLSLGSSLNSQKTDTGDEDQRIRGQDNTYTSSREDSFTDQSGVDEVTHLVQQTFDDSDLRHTHPATAYDDRSGHPLKSPESSGGFEHQGKSSRSHSSSGRSEVKSSRISSDKTDISRSAVNSKRSEVESDRSEVNFTQFREKSSRSNISSRRSSVKSDRSEVKSDKSNVSSGRSAVKSDRSEVKSDRSAVSRRSEVNPHSEERERKDSMDREPSPETMTPRRYIRESSVLTNVTSVWDSVSSSTGYMPCKNLETITDDPDTLMEMRKSVSMELLWVQQAINSRKNYLKIKDQMKIPVSIA